MVYFHHSILYPGYLNKEEHSSPYKRKRGEKIQRDIETYTSMKTNKAKDKKRNKQKNKKKQDIILSTMTPIKTLSFQVIWKFKRIMLQLRHPPCYSGRCKSNIENWRDCDYDNWNFSLSSVKQIVNKGQRNKDGVCKIYEENTSNSQLVTLGLMAYL